MGFEWDIVFVGSFFLLFFLTQNAIEAIFDREGAHYQQDSGHKSRLGEKIGQLNIINSSFVVCIVCIWFLKEMEIKMKRIDPT